MERRWAGLLPEGVDAHLVAPGWTVLERFVESAQADADAPALHYFGRTISRGELLALSERVATVLHRGGVEHGMRVAIALQNGPFFVAGLIATWGLGAAVVPINSMVRPGELGPLLEDSGASALLAHPEMAEIVDRTLTSTSAAPLLLWVPAVDLAGHIPLPFADERSGTPQQSSLLETCAQTPRHALRMPAPADVALLTYTSGTTGPSKGAIATHANIAYQAVSGSQWFGCDERTSILTTAPLFHITGLGVHAALALANGLPMVLTHRFQPSSVLTLIDRHRPTITVGAITAFISLLDARPDSGRILSLLDTIFSGGAPVPVEVVKRFEQATGRYIHNIYGLTETASACIAVPLGTRAPAEANTGALSIGIPMGGTDVSIVDESGASAPPGVAGEIVVRGPQVSQGYWNRPDDTAQTFQADGLHTGDVGVMDAQGYVYVVDRQKDLIVVSGYKVWPREVEEVLYRHPAVREVAVVGVPDPYRGETVHAHVVTHTDAVTGVDDLRSWCGEHMSAYKVPTAVTFTEELPKTSTGKILRRNLRS